MQAFANKALNQSTDGPNSRNAPMWRYAAIKTAAAVEFGSWNGAGSRSLRPHFHDETQITIVMSGRRVFHIGDRVVQVSTGQGLLIPAGQVHTPVGVPSCETACLNFYIENECNDSALSTFGIGPLGALIDDVPPDRLVHSVQSLILSSERRPVDATDAWRLRSALAKSKGRVEDIAREFHLSREAFSRRVRRELNIAPHAFRIITQLNSARKLLREGRTIADVAADVGFADQSHLTRLFREAFGTTPSHYRRK